MTPAITELELTDFNTISIPTDAIFILSLLIIFTLLGYFFHNILNNQIKQFVQKVDDKSNLKLVKEKLEDQLIHGSTTLNQERLEKPSIKKLNFLPCSKYWGIRSLALIAIGGASLLRIQSIQNGYKGMITSLIDIKTENKSTKSLLSRAQIKSSNEYQKTIKKISYIDPLLSTNNSSKNNNFLQIKERKIEDFFSF